MNTKDQLAQHTSQISRLEQVMTALAEAQVRSEDKIEKLEIAMTRTTAEMSQMAAAITKLAEAQITLTRQWEAYINTLPRQ
jgi:chromosome segregation ATPase